MSDNTGARLIAHWKLDEDCRDSSGNGHHGVNYGVVPGGDGAAFNGLNSYIEVPDGEALNPGGNDFSVAAWVHTEGELDGAIGDVVSKFDFASRRGFSLSLVHNVGGMSQNYRNVHFGIDDETEPIWMDCGRPGNAVSVWALAVHGGDLYAGTYEFEKDEAGHVFRYEGGREWRDCGSPDRSNSVVSLVSFNGRLHATTAYSPGSGSCLPESENTEPGGRLYRYEGDKTWSDRGPGGCPIVFKGCLYVYSIGDGGFHRHDGTHDPEFIPCPWPRSTDSTAATSGRRSGAWTSHPTRSFAGRGTSWPLGGGSSPARCPPGASTR